MEKFKGKMVTGDFQENTVTIEMEEPIVLKAGEYMVIPVEKYTEPELLEALQKILSNFKSCIAGGNGELESDKADIEFAENVIKKATEL